MAGGIGEIGEDIACAYLRDKKWKILFRNARQKWGELDIIAKDSEGVLVFIEVKSAHGDGEYYKPEDHYSFDKGRKTKRAALSFANQNPSLINDSLGWRIDLVTVLVKSNLLTDWKKDCVINHYENVAAS